MRFVLSILYSQWRGNFQGAFSDLSQIFYMCLLKVLFLTLTKRKPRILD